MSVERVQTKTILLKTTIDAEDDWHIGRFSILIRHLESCGHRVFAHDRREVDGADRDLASLKENDVDQVWLFAVDIEDALTPADAAALIAFREQGGGLLITRDHEDMGCSLLQLGDVGEAHHFQTKNPEPDIDRHCVDDTVTDYISWPNYHTGANGDFQTVSTPLRDHPLVLRQNGEPIQYLPAHPHEGVVSLPERAATYAGVVIEGRSRITGNTFGSAVAFDHRVSGSGQRIGRAVAQSTFHHFVDPNLDPSMPSPSFVSEPPGRGITENPTALRDALRYIENIANWL